MLRPQARTFNSPVTETSEAAIATRLDGQLYTVIGKEDVGGRWQLRLWWKPFVTLIWLGGGLVALGGVLALLGRVLRRRATREEAEWLFAVRGVGPAAADPAVLDRAIAGAGLEVVDTLDLASEWGEWSEEHDGRASRALLHLARLLRRPERYRAEFGDEAYQLMLADCRWHVHRMEGKLAGRVDVLRRPARG